jgi:hypothetical protein
MIQRLKTWIKSCLDSKPRVSDGAMNREIPKVIILLPIPVLKHATMRSL